MANKKKGTTALGAGPTMPGEEKVSDMMAPASANDLVSASQGGDMPTAFTMPGAGATTDDWMKYIQQMQDVSNAANERRYQQGLGELTGARDAMRNLYGQAASSIGSVGRSAAQDVNIGARRSFGTGMQSLVGSGLSGTTMVGSLARGVEEDRSRAMNRVNESVSQNMANLYTGQASGEMAATGSIADFISGKYETGPDVSQFADYIRMAAEAEEEGVGEDTSSTSSGGGVSTAGGGDLGYAHISPSGGGGSGSPGDGPDESKGSGGGGSSSNGGGDRKGDKSKMGPGIQAQIDALIEKKRQLSSERVQYNSTGSAHRQARERIDKQRWEISQQIRALEEKRRKGYL